MNDYTLYHHGILGQKWGVRRYQNYDGTLTTAGKKRNMSDDAAKAKAIKKKKMNQRTNEELQYVNERLRLEKEYQSYTKSGHEYAKKFLAEAGGKVVGTALTAGMVYVGSKYVGNMMKTELRNLSSEIVSKVGKEAVTNAAKNAVGRVRTNVQNKVGNAAKGNDVAKKALSGLNKYGQAVDRIIRK